jgi:hypothetical protein
LLTIISKEYKESARLENKLFKKSGTNKLPENSKPNANFNEKMNLEEFLHKWNLILKQRLNIAINQNNKLINHSTIQYNI